MNSFMLLENAKKCCIPQPTAWNTCQSIGLQTTAYLLIVFCGSSLLRLEQPATLISWLDSCCRRWLKGTWAVVDDRRSVWHWSGSWDIISSARRYYTTTPTRIPSSPTARNISWSRLYEHLNSQWLMVLCVIVNINIIDKTLTISPLIPLRLHTLQYWCKPPVLIFDIRALWRSVLSATAPECQESKLVG